MVRIFSKPGLHKSKSQGTKTYTEATLFPVLSVDKLLLDLEKNHYLNKLQEIVTLPDDYFRATYIEVIDNYASFVQTLPEMYGEELGGLLHDGLRRALLAIQIVKETQDKPHPLFIFAIFSIALLADVGQVLNYHVMISDERGVFIEDWYPLLGYLPEYGEYYKLRPYENTPVSLIRGATPLLAKQLLSETAITWLTSNNQIFDMWLAFLNKGEDWAGGLAKILKIDPTHFENRRDESGLVPVDIKLYDPMATDLAEKFLAWLKNGLQDGTISYNEADSKVHVVKMNDFDLSVFLQAPELFQQFANVYVKTRDWVVVCKQFNALGLSKLCGDDLKFEQFFGESIDAKQAKKMGFLSRALVSAQNFKEGIVVKVGTLFGSKDPPISQHLRGVDMRWNLNTVLPQVRRSITNRMPSGKPERSL